MAHGGDGMSDQCQQVGRIDVPCQVEVDGVQPRAWAESPVKAKPAPVMAMARTAAAIIFRISLTPVRGNAQQHTSDNGPRSKQGGEGGL